MTTATGTEEVPFVSGMEHEPPKFCEQTVSVGRKIFALDGMLTRVLDKAKMAMGASGRGPDPDVVSEDEERILIPVRFLERLSSRIGGGPGSVNNGWQPWILGIVGALIVASVLGLTSAMFTMTGRMATLEAKMDMLLKDRK